MRGCVVVSVLVVALVGGWSAAGQETPGTKMISTIDKTLLGVQKNLYTGIKTLSTPMVKFTVDTVPHLVHIFALVRGVLVPPKVAALVKESVGRLTLLAGTLGSDVAVMGSSMLADVERVTSVALEAQNNIAAQVGQKSIKLSGGLVENLINVTSLGVDAAALGLTALGDTLVTAAEANGAMSGASARLISAIGATLQRALVAAQNGAYTIASPLLGLKAKQDQTTNVASYLTALKSAQKVFDKLVHASENESTSP